ncbi:MAG: hypothetical protein ABIL05_03335, partial [candidate division WOR-3 bacterium]
MKTTSLLAQLIPIILNSAPVENSKSDLDKVINFLLGKYTISEHLMTGRLPAELLYYQGKLILPDEWWAKNRLTIGLTAGAGWIYLNEYYEFFIEPYKREYSTFLEVILKDPDTRYDMGLATFNLILFAVEKLIPTFDGVILIETHSPYLLNNWLNPLRTCGLREEVVISSKYLSFRKFLLGIA